MPGRTSTESPTTPSPAQPSRFGRLAVSRSVRPAGKVDEVKQWVMSVRGQVAAERELQNPPARMRPLQPGFIDLPQKLLDGYKRKQDASELGKVLRLAQRLRDNVDRVVILGIGG